MRSLPSSYSQVNRAAPVISTSHVESSAGMV
jgi:hypothetical protein